MQDVTGAIYIYIYTYECKHVYYMKVAAEGGYRGGVKEEKGSRGIETSSPPSIHAYIPPLWSLSYKVWYLQQQRIAYPREQKREWLVPKGGEEGKEDGKKASMVPDA